MRAVILAAAGGYSSVVVKSVASWSVRSRKESERERATVAQHTKTERGKTLGHSCLTFARAGLRYL